MLDVICLPSGLQICHLVYRVKNCGPTDSYHLTNLLQHPPSTIRPSVDGILNNPPLSYYACNSEQLKVKDMYLYEEDPE